MVFCLSSGGADKRGIKTVLHMHNEKDLADKIKVDAFLGCSNFIVDSYKKRPVEADCFECIYNGVDLERFKPFWEVRSLREDLRDRFGIKGDEFVVLFVGRVSPEKGVEHLVRSAFILKNEDNIRFFIVGEIARGRRDNKRVRYGMEVIRLASPLKEKIVFTDVFPPAKIHLLYLLGDVLVLPSNFEEPFPMVPIEAMATGLPVIVRKRGGLKEYLVDGKNGLFIDDAAPGEDIADKIRLLYGREELRRELGKRARETVERHFSWERIASDTENFYNDLLKER